jgi:DNA end-binding protein Ku
MPRALWKGAINFGLVNIPVELYPAEERREFRFAMLDKRDLSPVGYKRYSKKSGREVEWKDVVKGYEYEKDQFVVLSDEDFKRANVKASRTVEIVAFVPLAEIPPPFYESPYYLAPTEHGQKVYALLREALKSTRLAAVAQVVIRTTQHLAVVVPMGRALVLDTLRYADELRDTKGLELPESSLKSARVSAKEVALAKRLIDEMTEHWKPEEFKNTYHQDLMRRIREKIQGGETHVITEPEQEEPRRSAQVIDLATLLKQSLEEGGSRRKPAHVRRSRTAQTPVLHIVSGSRGSAHPPAAKRRRA